MQEILSIEEAFGALRDPRSRTLAHDLQEMLVVALCAILSGADSWVAIQLWAEAKLDWLRRHVPLASGVSSHDTFGRVFAALDARQFEACFMRWVAPLCPALHAQVVAIDGKTVRGSHHDGARAIHLVSAYGFGLGVVLGQQRTPGHSNEITAIPGLLVHLLLKGAIVTIDAMGCQTQIARKIVDARADYVLALKDSVCPSRAGTWRVRGTGALAATACGYVRRVPGVRQGSRAYRDTPLRGAGHPQRVAGQGHRALAGAAHGGDDRVDA